MTVFNTTLVADVPPGPPPGRKQSLWDRQDFWITVGVLAVTLLLGGVVVFLVDRWRRRDTTADARASGEELTGFRGMYERGELTEEEYAKVRAKVANRVKAKVAAEKAAAPPPPAKPAPPIDPDDRPPRPAPPLGAPPDDPS